MLSLLKIDYMGRSVRIETMALGTSGIPTTYKNKQWLRFTRNNLQLELCAFIELRCDLNLAQYSPTCTPTSDHADVKSLLGLLYRNICLT